MPAAPRAPLPQHVVQAVVFGILYDEPAMTLRLHWQHVVGGQKLGVEAVVHGVHALAVPHRQAAEFALCLAQLFLGYHPHRNQGGAEVGLRAE